PETHRSRGHGILAKCASRNRPTHIGYSTLLNRKAPHSRGAFRSIRSSTWHRADSPVIRVLTFRRLPYEHCAERPFLTALEIGEIRPSAHVDYVFVLRGRDLKRQLNILCATADIGGPTTDHRCYRIIKVEYELGHFKFWWRRCGGVTATDTSR